MITPSPLNLSVRPIVATIRTVPFPLKPIETSPTSQTSPPPPLPFVTISREPYAGAWSFAQQLVEALNTCDPGPRPWTCWDRELVEKVAADHNLSKVLIEAIENERHSWLTDFLTSLSYTDGPEVADESRVYQHVATTIRKLAASGRVVIVGRGGVFITRHMPAGIHIRLVAPFEHRVAFFNQQCGIKPADAPGLLRQLERNRHAFYKRHWPNESISPENFAATLNTAQVNLQSMIQIVESLVLQPVPAPN
ncbi:MAG: cytidylate kinase-like family protein [Planctomycetota bacterium]|nr:cytidylate kinase-like family protein [Planctomycetota bacterium]